MDLIAKTIEVCEELGVEKAAEFYGVSAGTISNWKRTRKPSAEAAQRTFEYYWVEPAQPANNGTGAHVHLQMPVYDRPSNKFVASIIGLCRNSKNRIDLRRVESTTIWRSRNILATQLLLSDAEWGFMVDADMVFPWGNAAGFNYLVGPAAALPAEFAGLHALDRLISRNEPLIGVAYVSRQPRGALHVGEAFRSDTENRSLWGRTPCNEVRNVSWIATGGLLYHKSVLKKIVETCPEIVDSDGVHPTKENGRSYQFFTPGYVTPEGRLNMVDGEDRAFMRRAVAAGFQPKVDLSILAAHEGTVCWTTKNAQPR